jgi:hypothetical protein
MAGLNSVGFSNSDNEVDLEGLRARLRKMPDAELLRYGQAAKSMCSPHTLGKRRVRRSLFNFRKHGRAGTKKCTKRNLRHEG